MLKIYHNPRCSKSRAGLEIVKGSGKDFQVVHYLKTPLSTSEIEKISGLLNIPAEDLVRKNETIWKKNYRDKKLSAKEIIQILHENPFLIQRPIVIHNDKAVIGRPPEIIKELFE